MSELKMSDYGVVSDEFMTLVKNAKGAMDGVYAQDPTDMSIEEIVEVYQKAYR